MSKKLISLQLLFLFIFTLSHSLCEAQELKGYSMPFTAPLYGSPPLKYSDSKIVTVVFKTSPQVLRKMVPQPLVPNPQGLMFAYTSSLNVLAHQSGEFSFPGANYFEVVLGIPVRFDQTGGNYCVVMYLDKTVTGVSFGREIWGYPKKGANITFVEEGGKVSTTVERFGTTIMKLSFERTQRVEPVPPRPGTPTFNLKFIPSIRKDAPPDVMQLTSNVSEFNRKELWRGKGSVEFGSLSADPLGDIPVLEIVAAEYAIAEGSLGFGEVVHDYLAKGKK
jgi:acetoacetate decarboxylase